MHRKRLKRHDACGDLDVVELSRSELEASLFSSVKENHSPFEDVTHKTMLSLDVSLFLDVGCGSLHSPLPLSGSGVAPPLTSPLDPSVKAAAAAMHVVTEDIMLESLKSLAIHE